MTVVTVVYEAPVYVDVDTDRREIVKVVCSVTDCELADRRRTELINEDVVGAVGVLVESAIKIASQKTWPEWQFD
jgi:hypothetical protein